MSSVRTHMPVIAALDDAHMMARCRDATRWRHAVTLLAAAGLLLVLCGCSGWGGRGGRGAVGGPEGTGGVGGRSPTGGIKLELLVQGEANLAVLYRVSEDGTIGYGGGADARNRTITWTGQMTPGEIDELRALLQQHGWFRGAPRSTGEPQERVSRIKLSHAGRSHSYKVRGSSPEVTPIEQLLDRVARRRFERFLESLPKAATRPREREPRGGDPEPTPEKGGI